MKQRELGALVGVDRMVILRAEAGEPTRQRKVLAAALEAYRLGCLPQPSPADGRWGWLARLFGALTAAEAGPDGAAVDD